MKRAHRRTNESRRTKSKYLFDAGHRWRHRPRRNCPLDICPPRAPERAGGTVPAGPAPVQPRSAGYGYLATDGSTVGSLQFTEGAAGSLMGSI